MATNNFLPTDQQNQPGQPPAGVGSPTLPASFGGPIPAGQTPPPSVGTQVVYTDTSGKGYNPNELAAAWGNGSTAFAQDPINARVRDILPQYGTVLGTPMSPTPSSTTTPPPPGIAGVGNAQTTGGQIQPVAPATPDPRQTDLFNLLMGRAKQSETIDPNDPIIKNQLDAYNANDQRAQRSYLSQAAEHGGPNANLDAVGRSLAERGAQGGSQLQSQLMSNELSSRRGEIQNALSEMGSQLTSQQQLSLQRELGLIDSQLRQQQVNSGNDQFMAQLGLNSENQNNYWDALRSGLL